jgi:hypothetical protein
MKDHYFYNLIKKTIIQFLDMFNDIRIARYDNNTGEIIGYIKVPLKFAPKTKNFYWVEKRDGDGRRIRDKILPIMGISMTDTEFDSNRLVNKHHKLDTNKRNDLNSQKYANLSPYNFTFEMRIIAQYMIDITQIIEQILPYFDPTAYIRITIPELNIDVDDVGYPLDLKVLLESSTKEDPIDMAEDEYRIVEWNITFKVEGYLSKKSFNVPVVQRVIQQYYMDTNAVSANTTTTIGLSAEKFPMDVSTEELSGALYDKDIPLLYKYEKGYK